MQTDIPDYAIVAYVRGGRFACVAAVLAVLHVRGFIDAGRNESVQRRETVSAPPDGLERIVWSAVHGSVTPGALASRPRIDRELNRLRQSCRTLGLIRPFIPVRSGLPARSVAGRRLVAEATRDCRWPPSPEDELRPVEDRVGLPVALYGRYALVELVPTFASAAGLLSRSSSDGVDWADAAGPGGRYY
jgi:hypothetical protein